MAGKHGAERFKQRSAVRPFFVVPVELLHCVSGLENLLCSALKRENTLRGRVYLSNVVPF